MRLESSKPSLRPRKNTLAQSSDTITRVGKRGPSDLWDARTTSLPSAVTTMHVRQSLIEARRLSVAEATRALVHAVVFARLLGMVWCFTAALCQEFTPARPNGVERASPP